MRFKQYERLQLMDRTIVTNGILVFKGYQVSRDRADNGAVTFVME
jgi:hypothetical protein